MKKKLTFTIFSVLLSTAISFSQYCMLPGQTPYSVLQPGITNFKLNTINRTSGNSESLSSVVVATGLTTTLTAGQTYTLSISHSEDANFFPGARNNLRVWIDYNSNFSYLDANETVLTANLQAPATTYTATFMIPTSVLSGTYNLRATAKMSVDAGHTLPTPCNVPADPLGYHGEMEDYTVVIESSNPGQSPISSFLSASTVCAKAALTVTNSSTGTPAPTFSWVVTPAAGVTFTPGSTAQNPQIYFANAGTYTITCMASNTVASNSSNKVVTANNCNAVGITERQSDNSFLVGPNPVSDILTISTTDETIHPQVVLTNYLGEVVYDKDPQVGSLSSLSIDVSMLPNGIYFVCISSRNERVVRQIVIQR